MQAFDDPAVVARLMEGIIFVILSGSTDREVALRALGRLPEDKIMGVVLNDMKEAVWQSGTSSAVGTPEAPF